MKTVLRWLFLPLFLPLPTLAAADTAEPLRLTLPGAVAMALSGNPDVALAQNRRQSASVDVEAARGRFLPSLQASAGTTGNFRHKAAPGTPDRIQDTNLQVSSSLNLFNGFADVAGLGASREQLGAADADLLRRRQTVAFTTASIFTSVLADGELVQVARQNLQSQKDLEEQIEAFYKAGVRSVTDLYQQRAATAQADLSLLDARRNLQIDQLQLLQVLGRTPPAEIEAIPPEPQALNTALQDLDLKESYAQALSERPDVLAQNRQIAASRQQVRAARSGYLPSLDLQAAGGSDFNSAVDGGNFASGIDDNRSASLGLSLAIPIFDRNQTRAQVAQARIGESDARTTLLKLQQQVGVEVGQALTDYERARQALVTAGRQLDYARQALAAAEARYKVGAATWIELSNARTVFVQAEGDAVRARFEVLRQGLNVGYARGDLGPLLALLNDKGATP